MVVTLDIWVFPFLDNLLSGHVAYKVLLADCLGLSQGFLLKTGESSSGYHLFQC